MSFLYKIYESIAIWIGVHYIMLCYQFIDFVNGALVFYWIAIIVSSLIITIIIRFTLYKDAVYKVLLFFKGSIVWCFLFSVLGGYLFDAYSKNLFHTLFWHYNYILGPIGSIIFCIVYLKIFTCKPESSVNLWNTISDFANKNQSKGL